MSRAGERLKAVALGVALAIGMLLLQRLSASLHDDASARFSSVPLRWALLVELGAGGVLAATALWARRDVLVPVAAALVLAVPLLPVVGVPVSGSVVRLLPDVGRFPLAVAIGVLGFAAATAGRGR